MVEISKMNQAAVLHLFGEVSLLEMDWVEGMVAFAENHVSKKAWLDLACEDKVMIDALKKATKKNIVGSGDVAVLNFCGADQTVKDFSIAADSVLKLLNQPSSPVKVFCEQIDSDLDEKIAIQSLLAGVDIH